MKNIIVIGMTTLGKYLCVYTKDMYTGVVVGELEEQELLKYGEEILSIYASNCRMYFGCRYTTEEEYVDANSVKIMLLVAKGNMIVYKSGSYNKLNILPEENTAHFVVEKYGKLWKDYSKVFEEINGNMDLINPYIKKEDFCEELVSVDFGLAMQSGLMWKTLSKKDKLMIVNAASTSENLEKKLENLEELIEDKNLWYHVGFSQGKILMGVLRTGDLDENWGNPIKTPEYILSKYGTLTGDDSSVFTYPLIDHAVYFKSGDERQYLISNPYLSDKEIDNIMKGLFDGENGKNYNGLKYRVLGKEKSFWSPGKSNCVMFYVED